MQPVYLSWTVQNFITVILMVGIAYMAAGLLGIGFTTLIGGTSETVSLARS